MNTYFEYTLAAGDRNLFACYWRPEGEVRAVVCLVHGLGEHSARYAHVAAALNRAGYAVVAYDQSGHGKTPGPRGHVKSYAVLLDDIQLLLTDAADRFPDVPIFLYGHSMGGGLVLNMALRRTPAIAGVIATAPLLRLAFEPPPVKIFLGRMMDKIKPDFTQASGLETAAISRDREVVYAYENDPLVHDAISARLFTGTFDSGLWALEHAAEFSYPLLLMHGSEDRLTSVQASTEFAAAAGEACTLKIWDGLYHEIHNEPEQEQVFAVMLAWLHQHSGVAI